MDCSLPGSSFHGIFQYCSGLPLPSPIPCMDGCKGIVRSKEILCINWLLPSVICYLVSVYSSGISSYWSFKKGTELSDLKPNHSHWLFVLSGASQHPCLFVCLLMGQYTQVVYTHLVSNEPLEWRALGRPRIAITSWPRLWAVLMVLLVGPLVSVPSLLLLGKGFTTQIKAPSSGRHHLHCRCTHYQSSPTHAFHECVVILLI